MAGEAPVRTAFFVDRADPRLKIAALAVWSVLLAILHSAEAAAAGLGCSVVLGAFSGVIFRFSTVRKILAVNVFLIFIWLFLPFSFQEGAPVGKLLGFTATREGILLSLTVSLKALAITAGAAAILGTSSVYEILAGARGLRAPEKAVGLLLLMYRYILGGV